MALGGHLEYAIKEAPGDPNAILGRKVEQRKKQQQIDCALSGVAAPNTIRLATSLATKAAWI